jgi:hypothetical protein
MGSYDSMEFEKIVSAENEQSAYWRLKSISALMHW